jgi:hypothetical protein
VIPLHVLLALPMTHGLPVMSATQSDPGLTAASRPCRARGARWPGRIADGPVVVLFEQDGANEADRRGVVGEDSGDVRAALDLLVDPLERVCRGDLAPVRARKAA